MVQETVQRVIEAAERAAGDGDALLSERREEREDPRQEVVRPLVTETVHRAAVDVQVVRVSEPAVATVAAGDRATYLPRGKPRSELTITIHSHRRPWRSRTQNSVHGGYCAILTSRSSQPARMGSASGSIR